MSALSFVLVCVAVLAVNVSALSDEERAAIRAATKPIILECAKEHNVKEEELAAAKATVSVKDLNPCFLKCFLEKLGIMDNNGVFDLEAMKEKSKALIKNDEDLKHFESIGEICAAVNDKPVTDPCERGQLLLQCLLENKADVSPFTS